MTLAGVNPFSMATVYTNGLNDEPGWRCALTAWLNSLRWKSGPPTIALTLPSQGSIATSAACDSGSCSRANETSLYFLS